ncbi:hypothetical protein [Methylobacterium segetis]|uniref:hypothetical protein n=1 Tax=Methylobacterium segetis TaxID=2488750 RepID=UPI001042C318|nr:hypothetical protein [Methylobacterium segetis]
MAEPQDMILPLLREVRGDVGEIRAAMREGFTRVDARFDKLERRFDNLREAVNGESVLGRYAAAEDEERLEAIEKRLARLETRS